MDIDLKKLQDFFPSKDIEFRIGAKNQSKTKGIALAYITNRAIQKRLDEVCGIANWKNEFREWKGNHQLCGISIRINGEWITKWDGADDTDFEGIKGGLSDSMKRAAAQWGIGRYLYEVPEQWVDIMAYGKTYKFKTLPKIPNNFLPRNDTGGGNAELPDRSAKKLDDILPKDIKIGSREFQKVNELITAYKLDEEKLCKWAKVEKIEDMTVATFNLLIDTMQKKYRRVKFDFVEAGDKND